MNICDICKKLFSNKYSLQRHVKGSFCKLKNEIICKYCDKEFTCNRNLENHMKICNEKYKSENTSHLLLIKELQSQNQELRSQSKELRDMVQRLEDKLENITLTAINRPTTTSNKTINQYIQKLQPIMPDTLTKYVDKLTIDHIKQGAIGYAKFFCEYPLKDAILCVDYSRLKFVFKDHTGTVISDPELTILGVHLFTAINDRNKELTNQYIIELKEKLSDLVGDEFDSVMETLIKMFDSKHDIELCSNGEKPIIFTDVVKELGNRTTT